MKTALTTAPFLAHPRFELPFTLQTDACTTGLGALLTQEHDGEEKIITCGSRSLSKAERNYSATELKCMAVIWAVEKYRQYLEGTHFTVITDHSSLQWLKNLRDPTGRLARWAMRLAQHDIDIIHREGTLHQLPDASSRMFSDDAEEVVAVNEIPETWYERRIANVSKEPSKFPDWQIVDGKLFGHRPEPLIQDTVGNLLSWKLVLTENLRLRALEVAHSMPSAGHLGVAKTFRRIGENFYWPEYYEDTARYVRECLIYQARNVEQSGPTRLMGQRVIERPWLVVAADIVGPLPTSRNRFSYLLVLEDLYTRWVKLVPLGRANAQAIITALEENIVFRYGAPQLFHTDNGTEFVNKALAEKLREYGIKHPTSPAYHPQANPVERVNRVVKTMISSFVKENHREWDVHLPKFRLAVNSAAHSSTKVSQERMNKLSALRDSVAKNVEEASNR